MTGGIPNVGGGQKAGFLAQMFSPANDETTAIAQQIFDGLYTAGKYLVPSRRDFVVFSSGATVGFIGCILFAYLGMRAVTVEDPEEDQEIFAQDEE